MSFVTLKNRAAFSMLELVFVIVILGIVASIGAEIIAQVYESYVLQRASQRSSVKTELAATQIANRLAYAIPGTVIGRNGANFKSIDDLNNTNYTILQWIAYDADSLGANRVPGWSGFADMDASSALALKTPGSNLATTHTIIQSLGGAGLTDAAVLFPNTYTVNTIGYGANSSEITSVTGGAGENLTVDLNGKTIKEHYKLAWSSYAIVPTANANGTFDLNLHYNFQPWNGSGYATAPSEVLLRNVSVFKFTGSANTIRFKICQQENIGEAFNITTCKEKAVIR